MAKISITIPDGDMEEIRQFCENKDYKLSSIFRRGAKELIEKENAN